MVGDGREDPDDRSTRVRRGGAWGYDRDDARVAYRGSYRPYDYLSYLGLRLVAVSRPPSLLDH
ncbi:MAG: hypothetical protein IPL28_20660 [Chloroflexi bacterium]|nr:hypothetical protein [Chloroflexota bacterium]